MKRILIPFAGLAMLVSSSFAVATSVGGAIDPAEKNYQPIQLETEGGKQVDAIVSKEQMKGLEKHKSGDMIKLHTDTPLPVKDKGDLGQDTKDTDTTTTNGVEQPAVKY